MHAHIGRALIIRCTARSRHAAAWSPEVAGQQGQIVADISDFGSVVEGATRDRRSDVSSRVEDDG